MLSEERENAPNHEAHMNVKIENQTSSGKSGEENALIESNLLA